MPPKTTPITYLRPIVGFAFLAALTLGLFFVGLMLQAHAADATPLLPNLVADPPDNVSFETSQNEGGLSGKTVTPELLLRFNGYVHNVGPGALDFRGAREAPKVSKATTEAVEHAREKEEGLPQKTEEELASPPMKVSQRLFSTNEGNPEKSEEYLGRSHEEVSSSAEMFYVNADGHHHWHLQRVAKYSLWNAAKTAEVAPAQKVGFCLEDSEHVEPSVGPAKPVYADNVPPYRDFCQQYRPNATGVYEGISPGWRDRYTSDLGFQWVDASNVLPGEYWLREDVNPTGVIKEAAGTNAPAYSTTPTIVPGFDALAQAASTQTGEAKTLTLTSKAWNDSATPKYTIVTAPQHGTLGAVSKNQVTYTPTAGYTGPDTFTFAASDPNSEFPRSPAVATVSIEVVAAGSGKGLLVGDATSAYSVGDQTMSGREESFQFTAKSSGTVEELQFRTDATANTGVTGVMLGVFAENAGKPGEVLGKATVSGEPAVSSWVKVTGLSTAVVNGTKYWLVVLPLGAGSTKLHYNVAVGSGGAGNLESVAAGLSALTAESSWETFNQGPVGFQAIGTSASQPPPPPPTVTIEGAPASMTAGTSVQLTAHVSNDSPTVTWKASAGAITAAGLYSAPSEPPVGGKAVITATTAKGAQTQVSIEVTAAVATKGLLVGDATSAYPVGDQTTSGREESFQFTAKSSGTVEELEFRTDATANTGVTGVTLGVFAENGGKPGEVLGKATVSGEPAVNSWVKATGLSTAVVSGTKYWLVVLPLGASSTKLHYNAAVGSGGAGNLESVAAGLSALTAESSWETFNQGPVGFQALGGSATQPPPAVTIEGAPASMTAGTSVQLTAHVTNDSPAVTWKASAGSITTGGLYSAPAEPPVGGKAVITATTAKGAQTQVSIEVTAAAATKGLLVGDATSAYSVGDQTTSGREESFQFTAKSSGTVEELEFRTDATANAGVTGVTLGVFAENGGKPGEVLGKATVSGEPAVSSWVKVTGLSTAVVSGTKYWLVVLPLGAGSTKLHYNVAVGSGGAGNLESVAAGLSALTAESSWETFNQGPVGFQALGSVSGAAMAVRAAVSTHSASAAPASPTVAASSAAVVSSTAVASPTPVAAPPAQSARLQPSVAIAGAPSDVIAGTSVQLSALLVKAGSGVTWRASAGSITSRGLYTAPSQAPRGGLVVLSAIGSGGARDQRRIAVVPEASPRAAPAVPLALQAGPQAQLVDGELVMTTSVHEAGKVRLSAYLGTRRLGSCAAQTPANRNFTCRLELQGVSPDAAVSVRVALQAGGKVFNGRRPDGPIPDMAMPISQFFCTPSGHRLPSGKTVSDF